MSQYIRLSNRTTAEPAVAVIDDYQGRGIGRLLVDALVVKAFGHGSCASRERRLRATHRACHCSTGAEPGVRIEDVRDNLEQIRAEGGYVVPSDVAAELALVAPFLAGPKE